MNKNDPSGSSVEKRGQKRKLCSNVEKIEKSEIEETLTENERYELEYGVSPDDPMFH
jgi:hypothetical protein